MCIGLFWAHIETHRVSLSLLDSVCESRALLRLFRALSGMLGLYWGCLGLFWAYIETHGVSLSLLDSVCVCVGLFSGCLGLLWVCIGLF